MDIVRIACLNPPATDRSRWSRELLLEAVGAGLTPLVLPADSLTSFTATLPTHLAATLKKLALERQWSAPQLAAGLIAAAMRAREAAPEASTIVEESTGELALLREELHPLFKGCKEAIAQSKIAFAEAATGTGKGRMIALLAAQAAGAGQRTVISAPLPILWQLAETLPLFEAARSARVSILLGRANFASPELLREWAAEHENAPLTEWIDAGGPPRDPRTLALQQKLGLPLNWLLEDALALADDLDADQVMLNADDEDSLGEQAYLSLRASSADADIILCSHHMLAADTQQRMIWSARQANQDNAVLDKTCTPGLPEQIDLLLVDEAHLLEQAFASIFSQSLHLKPLERQIERSAARGKRPALDALTELGREIQAVARLASVKAPASGPIDQFPVAQLRAQQLLDALDALSVPRREKAFRQVIQHAKRALRDFLSGHGTVRLDISPVREYPQLLVGRANLQKQLEHLWDRAAGATLVSATLYADGMNAGLTRWKLGVPKERARFLPPVIPSWVVSPVRVLLPAACDPQPDDSEVWLSAITDKVLAISAAAAGGTLALCTSYQTVASLGARLAELGDRLIIQGPGAGAAACASRFRTLYATGVRPVWIGVGSAWTGIDLHDDAVSAEHDRMLTDLVVTRLPLGTNRTLTHERRASIAGFGVIAQEAVWQLRQGIGRLVRRQGIAPRNLWVLDPRLVGKEAWTTSFRQALARYQQIAPGASDHPLTPR